MTLPMKGYPVTLEQQLAWGDMDALNHINNIVYFRYFENVRIKYFEKTGLMEIMSRTQIRPVLGATECKFLAPLTYPDTLIVGAEVSELREKRLTMEYLIFSQAQQRTAAQGKAEIIFVDFSTGQSTLIPETTVTAIINIQVEC